MKEKILRKWARFAATHPWRVIIGLLVITVIAVVFASNIRMEMRWSDLMPMGDPMAQEFDQILKEYRSASTILVVVQGGEQQMKRFADEIAPKMEQVTEYIERVDYKLDMDFFAEHGFMLANTDDLERSADMFNDLNLVPLFTHLNDNFEEEYSGNEEALNTKSKEDDAVRSLDGFQYWLQVMDAFIRDTETATPALADSAVDRFLYGDPYVISQDKRVLLLSLKPTFTSIDQDKCVGSKIALQKILDETLPAYPDLRAGLAGVIPLQADEMEHMQRTMRISSIVALVLVLLLFILTFRMVSAPILAGLNLIIAIIITVGVVGLTIGRLNMMTAVFAIILIGLGIDYAIHIISVYGERRSINGDPAGAMEETFVRAGSGIITGALTTAAAFFALAISSTQGIKEMGIVLGIGILCAMLTTLSGLPAILVARERVIKRVSRKPFKQPHVEFKILERYGRSVMRRPLLFLIIAIVLTGFLLYQALNVKFNYDMMSMEPKGLLTVELQDTIIEAFDLSTDFAMVTATSIDESWELAEKAKSMPSFSNVENIGDVCPPEHIQRERQPHVEKIQKQLNTVRPRKPLTRRDLDRLIQELERLDMNIYELAQLAYIGGQDKVDAKCKSLIGDPESEDPESMILDLAEKIKQDPDRALKQLNSFTSYYHSNMHDRVTAMANPELITLDILPDHIRSRYVNEAGTKFLVSIYPREEIWDFEVLDRFTKQLQTVSPRVTGTPPMFLRLIQLIGRDGLWATILTLGIVIALLWADFRSPKLALLGIIPLVAGGIWMIGIMKSLGMLLDFVNLMGIPMIVGIGIDDGVHILHRYKFEGFGKTPLVLMSTGKAILLTSLTTMAGFGSLMLGEFPGYQSLGALLALGVAACFITTMLFIPSIIGIIHKNGQKKNSA
jgi:predicted RND superfamily exporter protein